MRFILALLLLTLPVLGQTISYPQSGSSSVVTNTATNAYNFVTNGAFASGTGGWEIVNASGNSWSWDEFGQRFRCNAGIDNQARFVFPATCTGASFVLSFSVTVTNALASGSFRVYGDEFTPEISVASFSATGTTAISTNILVSRLTTGGSWGGTQLLFGVVSNPDDLTGSGVFFDNITLIDTNYFQSSITTNSVPGGSPNISVGKTALGVTR